MFESLWRQTSVEAAGILRSAAKQVEYHGKGSCDAMGNVPNYAIKDAIVTGKLLDPGTRELFLYLAENKRTPSIPKASKPGWEAAGGFYWGYMNTDRFTKFAVQDASVVGFPQSKKHHEFIGDCTEREAAEKMGRMRARLVWCSCGPCMLGHIDDCEMKAQMGGSLRRVTAPLAAGVQERRPQTQSLEEWGDVLADGMLAAVRADEADHHMEGVYWLVRVLGPAFAAPSRLVHASAVFEEG